MTAMDTLNASRVPAKLEAIRRDRESIGFAMSSVTEVGALLRSLAASKPAGRLLELGTGVGEGTAWLLDGMGPAARLDSIDNDPTVQAIAARLLGDDPRVRFEPVDGEAFLARGGRAQYDLIYADAWPGKFTHLEEALSLLTPGGIYVVDDLLPQATWPDNHSPRVDRLLFNLQRRPGFVCTTIPWASGVAMLVRTSA